jgi:hypothetical protein
MKKIFKSSIVLLFFSLSIVLFNASCEKEANAQPSTLPQNVGVLIFKKDGDRPNEVWTSRYDGSNQTKITISSFPIDGDVDWTSMRLSPDGKKIFFAMYIPSTRVQSIFVCNIDGSGLNKVVDNVDEFSDAI